MNTSSTLPRRLAMDSLVAIEEAGKYANLEIDAVLRRHTLSSADSALYTRLVYGVTEKRITLDFVIDTYARETKAAGMDPYVRTALRLGIYQLAFCDRIPAHAAVSETVELAARAKKGFVNAILRAFLRDGGVIRYPDPAADPIYAASVRYSLPCALLRLFADSYGMETAEKIAAYTENAPTVSLRCNTMRLTEAELADRVGGKVTSLPGMVEVPVIDDVVRACLTDGDCFVEDPASRLCTCVVDARPGETIADTCACPGGKSFSMALDMADDGTLCAFDLHENKLSLVTRTAAKLGLTCIRTEKRDAREPAPALIGNADRVLCDAPCSGLGVLAKKPDIRYKSIAGLEHLPEVQRAVLDGASRYVKPGGVLVYSTCTLRRAENEDVVADFLENHGNFALEPFTFGTYRAEDGMLTLFPHLHHTDGFFIARLRRDARMR